MKVRAGFVSNSSSSSFMGGIGIIADFEKFSKWKDSFNNYIKEEIMMYERDESKWSDIKEVIDKLVVQMPVNSEPTLSLNIDKIKDYENNVPIETQAKNKLLDNEYSNVVYFIIGNGEGDSAFQVGDYDLDYDIDLDFFDSNQQRLYNEFGSDKSGIVEADKMFGADRNG